MIGGPLWERTERIREAVARQIAVVVKDPDVLTYSSLIFALLFAATHILGMYVAAFVFLALAYGIDAIDGSVARVTKRASKWGNYLDAMMDKYVEGIVYIALGIEFPFPALLAAVFTFIESYAKPRTALVVPIDNHDWPAIGERAERGLIIILGYIASIIFQMKAVLAYTLYFMAAVTLIGSIQRMLYAKKIIETRKKS